MADERSTRETHARDKHCERYDWEYYKQLLPLISGDVLDIGSGAGMFVEQYAKKEEVKSITCLDKYLDELVQDDKVERVNWKCPEPLPELGVFDTVVSTEFIEHIERGQLEPLLEQIKGTMHKDSVFIGSTPNKIAPTTNPYHLYEYTLSELLSIFKNYFTEVEAWDNGQNCTLWKAKL